MDFIGASCQASGNIGSGIPEGGDETDLSFRAKRSARLDHAHLKSLTNERGVKDRGRDLKIRRFKG
jgi:hypothetical protein